MKATEWLDSTCYVERAAWFGAFSPGTTPGSYASPKNAFFQEGGHSLTGMGLWFAKGGASSDGQGYRAKPAPKGRGKHARALSLAGSEQEHRMSRRRAHAALALTVRDNSTAVSSHAEGEGESEAVHCDAHCANFDVLLGLLPPFDLDLTPPDAHNASAGPDVDGQ